MIIPSDIYTVPTIGEQSENPLYWSGYKIAQKITVPSPAGTVDYPGYRKLVDAKLFPLAASNPADLVGANAAIVDGANWLWVNDPESPHNVVA